MLRKVVLIVFAFVLFSGLSGCAVTVGNLPRNLPAVDWNGQPPPPGAREPLDVVGETTVAMSFSGGGTRAAAFAFGALQGLDKLTISSNQTLLDQLSFITSVSGGSLTAAYYGLHGKSALETLREDGLMRNGEADLRFSLLNPVNITRLVSGGLNDRSTYGHWLDDQIFKGATFGDMFKRGKPVIRINATDLYHRVAFPFNQGAFDILCSDLASYPVADAVAASMAVPLLFAPVVLEKHPANCHSPMPDLISNYASYMALNDSMLMRRLVQTVHDFRDTKSGPYIKLVDGGISDNYGLMSIQQSRLILGTPYGPLSPHDAITVRRLLFIVVDGGQSPVGNWNQTLKGPAGIDLARASIDSAIETNVRMSYDSFVPMVKTWRNDVIDYRCHLPDVEVAKIRADHPQWRCDDVSFDVTRITFEDLGTERAARLNRIPVSLTLPENDIDELIAAGRDAIVSSPTVMDFHDKVSQKN